MIYVLTSTCLRITNPKEGNCEAVDTCKINLDEAEDLTSKARITCGCVSVNPTRLLVPGALIEL